MAVAGAHPLLAPPVHLAEVRVVAEPEHEVRPHGADRREDAVVATVGRAGPVVGRVVDVEARADGGGEVRGVGAPLPERLRLELRRVRPHRRHAVDEDVVAVARARLQLGEVERGDVVVLGRRSEDGCDAGGGGPGAPRLGRRVAELHVRRPRRLHPYGHLAVRDVAEHRPGLQRLRPLRDGDGRRRGDVARGVRPRAGRLQHRTAGEEDEQEGEAAEHAGAERGVDGAVWLQRRTPRRPRRDVAGRGAERDGKAGITPRRRRGRPTRASARCRRSPPRPHRRAGRRSRRGRRAGWRGRGSTSCPRCP